MAAIFLLQTLSAQCFPVQRPSLCRRLQCIGRVPRLHRLPVLNHRRSALLIGLGGLHACSFCLAHEVLIADFQKPQG